MLRMAWSKVATPATALFTVTPVRVSAPGLLLTARVTASVTLTRLPPASWICTVIAGLMALPAIAFDGCWTKASWAFGPSVTLNGVETAEVSAPLVAVSV